MANHSLERIRFFFVGCSPPLHALKLGDNRLVRIEGDVHIWEVVVSFQARKNDGVVCGIRTKLVGDLEGHLEAAAPPPPPPLSPPIFSHISSFGRLRPPFVTWCVSKFLLLKLLRCWQMRANRFLTQANAAGARRRVLLSSMLTACTNSEPMSTSPI